MRSSERELLLAKRAQVAGEDEIEIVDKVELGIEELVDDHVAHTQILITVGIERQLRALFGIVGAAGLARRPLLLPGEVKRVLATLSWRIERLQGAVWRRVRRASSASCRLSDAARLDDAHLHDFPLRPKRNVSFHVAVGCATSTAI
jgi:hypothetical protein